MNFTQSIETFCHPFGMVMPGRNWNYISGLSNIFGYQSSQRLEEVNVNNYSTYYRELDTRIGRWWSLDPRFTMWESPYISMSNNPVRNNDIFGDKIKGINETSAKRLKTTIQNSFKGDEATELRNLFKLSDDKLTMATIDEEAFTSAIANLTPAQQDLAYAYFSAINDQVNTHMVEMLKKFEPVSSKTLGLGFASTDAIQAKGGPGFNVKDSPTSTFTVVIMDANQKTTDYIDQKGNSVTAITSPGEVLAHEALGHGVGNLAGSTTYKHEDAVQMGNLYLRAQGAGYYRDGTGHKKYTPALTYIQANSIPKHLMIPMDMQIILFKKKDIVVPEVKIDNNIKEPNYIIKPPLNYKR